MWNFIRKNWLFILGPPIAAAILIVLLLVFTNSDPEGSFFYNLW